MEREDIQERVKDFIKQRGKEFENAFGEIKSFFESYQKRSEGAKIIYQINGRDYYQNGKVLKTDESIVDKMEKRRDEQIAKGEKSTYDIENVEDIIGVRLICVYPTDVKKVCDYITNSADSKSRLDIISKPELVEKDSGYRAMHTTVRPKGYSESIKCEVQVATMLQETWSFKTHDLVYKGENVEQKYQKHTRYLSDALEAIDKQSEVVKDQIEERKREEEDRRTSLVGEHLLLLLGPEEEKWELDKTLSSFYNPSGINFSQIDDLEQALKLLKYLVKEKIGFGFKPESIGEEDISLLSDQINRYKNRYKVFEQESKYKICNHLSLIASLCAVIGESEKFIVDALDYSDKLIKYSEEKDKTLENRVGALVHKGWTFFCLKRPQEALRWIEKALELAETSPEEKLLSKNKAKNDWAYFVAEMIDESRKRGKKLPSNEINQKRDRAFKYIEEIIKEAKTEQDKAQWEDTLGFLHIVFGKNFSEIEKGKQTCEKAYNKSLKEAKPAEKEIANLYYRKHTRRALERALNLFK